MSKPTTPPLPDSSKPKYTLAELMQMTLNGRDNGLGDRSLYFGASEILRCEEAMFRSKILKISKPKTLRELIVALKGNVAERLVELGLGEAEFDPQVEAKGSGEYSFITLHADFVVTINNRGEQIIVEVKTTGNVPDVVRETWFLQTQVQMGLLGIKRAIVFAMDLNTGDYEEFPVVFSQTVFENTLKDMKAKWDRIHQPDYSPVGERGPLCAYCEHKLECNALKTEKTLPDDIAQMAAEVRILKKKIAAIEENVRAFMEMSSFNRVKNDKHNVIVELQTRSSYETIDRTKLKFEYPEVYKEVAFRQGKTTAMTII